ncbi:MAG: stage 0 sporulation protein [Bacilli bacterium]|nr:stage 0 sporulation protein [Bacilli bacterium]
MTEVVIVKVLELNLVFYLSPRGFDLKKGDTVIFNVDGTLYHGIVFKEPYLEKNSNLMLPLSKVLRLASKSDIHQIEKNRVTAEKALKDAKRFSKELNLDMNFIDSFYYFDNSQLLFNFISDNRVDFRELAKKLASKYKTRIELRQVGIRDKAKKIGGLGPCGLFLCCNTFLTDFNSVSINMAKNQMLALNPSKINGICNRLLCCLDYENDTYNELKKDLPKIGFVADTPLGMGKVVSLNVFEQTYSVDLGEKGIVVVGKEKKK